MALRCTQTTAANCLPTRVSASIFQYNGVQGLRDEETFHDTRIAMNGRGQLLHVTGYKDSIAGLVGLSLQLNLHD